MTDDVPQPDTPAICAQCGEQTLLTAFAWNHGWHAFQVCFPCDRIVAFTLTHDDETNAHDVIQSLPWHPSDTRRIWERVNNDSLTWPDVRGWVASTEDGD